MTDQELSLAMVRNTPVAIELEHRGEEYTATGWVQSINRKSVTIFLSGARFTVRVRPDEIRLATEEEVNSRAYVSALRASF